MVRIAPAFGPQPGQEVAPTRGSDGVERAPGVGFHNGQVLEVELIKAVGADEGLFRIAGKYFRALYPTGLTPGVAVPMRVMDTGPPLVLRLPDLLAQMMARLVHPSHTSFAKAFSSLTKMLDSGAFTGESGELASRLKELLTLPAEPKELARALEKLFLKNGVYHEALLARGEDPGDVKALAMKMLALFGEDEKAGPALKALLSHIEAFQARSLVHENPVFPFFLNWGGEEIKGEFEIKKEEAGQDGVRGGGLVVRLELPNLGHVEGALWWYAGAVSVTLRVPRELEGWLSERVEPLKERLREVSGINLSTLRVEAKDPGKPAAGRFLLEITV